MDAQEIREKLKLGEIVLVNGHTAVIEKVDENGVLFVTGSDVDLSSPITITRLNVFDSKGEYDVW